MFAAIDQLRPSQMNTQPVINSTMTQKQPNMSGRRLSFPLKIQWLLLDAATHNFESIISWNPNGTAFKVHDREAFVDRIMPHYFSCTKYKSFQRNLNLWGFEFVHKGPNAGCWYHPMFLRDEPQKCRTMVRQKIKNPNAKTAGSTANDNADTDSAAPADDNEHSKPRKNAKRSSSPAEEESIDTNPSADETSKGVAATNSANVSIKTPIPATAASMPTSSVLGAAGLASLANRPALSDNSPTPLMSFFHDLQSVLGDKSGEFSRIMIWATDNVSFSILDWEKFKTNVAPRFFGPSVVDKDSFLLRLQMLGFLQVAPNTFTHQLLFRAAREPTVPSPQVASLPGSSSPLSMRSAAAAGAPAVPRFENEQAPTGASAGLNLSGLTAQQLNQIVAMDLLRSRMHDPNSLALLQSLGAFGQFPGQLYLNQQGQHKQQQQQQPQPPLGRR